MKSLFTVIALVGLSSCTSPPKPPSVDQERRHPVNAAAEVGLQTCKSELQNARILVSEKVRDSDGLRARVTALAAARVNGAPTIEDWRSSTYMVLFPFGATSVGMKSAEADALIAHARTSPMIVLSGRTDGMTESPAESRVARERSEFIRDVLLRAGIPAARIRTTWQPIGDHAADNGSVTGRSLNRRVEIEVYRAAPRVARLDPRDAA